MSNFKATIKSKLEAYFDIKESYTLGEVEFPLYAVFNQRNAKYMLLKNVEIYAFENNEHIFLKTLDQPLCSEDLVWLKSFLEKHVKDIITYDKDHMSSSITMIFESKMPENSVQKQLEKFKFYKSFAFGFKGWVNAKVMLIDPTSDCGIANKLGRDDLKKFIKK